MIGICGETIGGVRITTLDCIPPLIANLVYWFLVFAGITAVVMIIISGIRFITSHGDPKNLVTAKKTFAYAILGLLLIFLSFAIVSFIATTTGVACISPTTLLSFESCN